MEAVGRLLTAAEKAAYRHAEMADQGR